MDAIRLFSMSTSKYKAVQYSCYTSRHVNGCTGSYRTMGSHFHQLGVKKHYLMPTRILLCCQNGNSL